MPTPSPESSTAPALPLRLLFLDRPCCSPDRAPLRRRVHPPAPRCRPRRPSRAPGRTLRHARASPRAHYRAKIPRPRTPRSSPGLSAARRRRPGRAPRGASARPAPRPRQDRRPTSASGPPPSLPRGAATSDEAKSVAESELVALRACANIPGTIIAERAKGRRAARGAVGAQRERRRRRRTTDPAAPVARRAGRRAARGTVGRPAGPAPPCCSARATTTGGERNCWPTRDRGATAELLDTRARGDGRVERLVGPPVRRPLLLG